MYNEETTRVRHVWTPEVGADDAEEELSTRVVRKPSEGGGMPEHRKQWLENFAPLVSPFKPSDGIDDGDPGVFRIKQIKSRKEPNYYAIANNLPNADVPKNILAITWVLHDAEGKEPILDGETKKPLAIEQKITRPSDNLSWENFKKSNFYELVGALGYEIQEEDCDYDYADMMDLFGVFEVTVTQSKKKADQKFGNIKPGTIKRPCDPKFAKAQREFNQKHLKKMFGK